MKKRLRFILFLGIASLLFISCGKVGPQGPKGEIGITGLQGSKGDKGDKGDQGQPGNKGDAGSTGAQGPQGDKGEVGDRGPQGNAGPMGAHGPQGDKGDVGDRGPKGDVGTSNVIYSDWKFFNNMGWSGVGTNRLNRSFYDEIREDIFTQEVIDKALVLVYTKEHEFGSVNLLPSFATDDVTGAILAIFNYSVTKGWLNLNIRSQMGNITDLSIIPESYFRYIIVPGGINITGRTQASVDFKDYDAVCRYYGLLK